MVTMIIGGTMMNMVIAMMFETLDGANMQVEKVADVACIEFTTGIIM